MQIFKQVLSVVLVLMLSLSLSAGTVKYPDTPAGKRAQEIVDLLNKGEREAVRQYVLNDFTPKFRAIAPMETHLQVFSGVMDTYKSFEPKDLSAKDDLNIKITAFCPKVEAWVSIHIEVEEKTPHRIASMGLGSGEAPGELAVAKKMTDSQMVEQVKTYLEKLVKNDSFSGTILLAKNGKILFKGAYGLASKRFDIPNRVDTKFNLGSMNKMFTSVAIAQLVEKGKLGYDDNLGKFLDESWIQKETADKVKIKHLLCHTSGLGSYFNEKYDKMSRLKLRTLDDYKPLIKDDKPRFEPGSRWSYSNSGMFLLGAVIEKVTGKTYYEYVQENIHKPMGMVNTACYEMDRPVPNLAIGYGKEYTEGGFYWRNNIYDHVLKGGPAGGGFSTVEDLFRFAGALREGKLINPQSVELLTTPKPELNSPRYGYGFGVFKIGDERIFGHGGGFTGINSDLKIYWKSGYTFAVMSNYSEGVSLIQQRLEDLIKAQL